MSDRKQASAKSVARARLAEVHLCDLEGVHLLLRGDSVVDWHRLSMRDDADVDRFLRVNELDPVDEADMQHLEKLRAEAVEYLRDHFRYRVADEVASLAPARSLFLIASRSGPHQQQACMTLKVMHIVHHLAGRELAFRLPISDDEIFGLLERKVVRVVEEMRAAGHPVVEFDWSRKPRSSLITKLLAKRSTLAASVYDKLRFRLVVREHADILPLLLEITHRIVPFNYVVPGESINDVLPLLDAIKSADGLSPFAVQLQGGEAEEARAKDADVAVNEFSGPSYRVINFVADVPIRIDGDTRRVSDAANVEFGPVVFVLTEFQVVDAKTARENEQGENSHTRYKARQLARVKDRLAHGLGGTAASEGGASPSKKT